MHDPVLMAQIIGGAGFVAALDQSGGSTPTALANYGISAHDYSGEEKMFALIHKMRSRLITAPSFDGRKILGAILFEKTMDGEVDGTPVPDLLRQRGIVPFVKIDRGLEDEKDGVRLMKPIPALETLLVRAKAKGVFGTKMRSLINEASTGAIGAIVDQQFDIANRILDKGLMPIVEPEVNLKSKSRAECDTILLGALTKALDRQPIGRRVMLKLSMPAAPDLFAPLVGHPSCARVLALSGGYSQEEACDELAKNHALVASFSRALLQDLRAGMDDEEFDRVLAEAIERIYRASTVKTAINPV
ncbi:fructose bisphosphate aldolase [Erythrobacter sp. 3-20A1M]|jgi:fructose-bisphosphate aldolase, class I|uniref:fructose bisphosphate aldolase n=1 Tax=Erythrobacteraceae TaxID=335929 RepID=UPI000DC70896|nr:MULTISPECIES: fructose bisphosphate aldolase [Erythrobacteraceae]QWC57802.1 fructose bisphosphate aldolase [Erythrobacter sp. 3-20A1M]BBC73523.1 class I fructose-bisphosphate aldolase [Altererythrobacter sp. B11]